MDIRKKLVMAHFSIEMGVISETDAFVVQFEKMNKFDCVILKDEAFM